MGLKIQIYADNTTLYINFLPLLERNGTFVSINNCLDEMKLFLTQSFLKLNADKTMTTFFGSKYHTSIYKELSVDYHGDILEKEPSFKKTLGVLLDINLSMEKQVNALCKSCSFSLHKLQRIRHSLDVPTRILLVKTFVLTKIDYCNLLLITIPDYLCHKLQLILNSCIRFVMI